MNWRFPAHDDIVAAERLVYLRRDALRWRGSLVAARVRRTLRSRTMVFLAGIAGLVLPSLLKSGVAKRLLAAGSMLRWVGPVLRIFKI